MAELSLCVVRRVHHKYYTQTYHSTKIISKIMIGSPDLPDLPLTNLGNAEFTATRTAFAGENTVIGELHYRCGLSRWPWFFL